MKRKIIKKLAENSFTKENVDEKKVKKFENYFSRADLKVYIKDLKSIRSDKIVKVTVANEDGIKELDKYFKRIYPNKKIVVSIDEDLINGVRVEEQNNEYEFSIKSFMEEAYKVTND